MLRLGAITDEISDRLERSLALFNEWGLQDVELHTLWGSSIERLEPGEVERLRRLLDEHGLRTCMLSSTVFLRCSIFDGPPPDAWDRRFDSIPGTYAEHVIALRRCLETAAALGAPLVRVFGFWPQEGTPAAITEVVVSRLREAADLAATYGIVLALENCPHSQLDHTRKVLEVLEAVRSPWLRLLWDPSNAWRCGERDLVGLIDRAAPRLAHMHLKGVRLGEADSAGRAYVPLDEGEVDYRQLLAGVLSAGYSGVFSLEPHYALPRTGREGAARESLARLRRLLDDLPTTDTPADSSAVGSSHGLVIGEATQMPARYHMIDYIHEGPEALRRTLEANERPVQELAKMMARGGVERVILTGIGSSHTALTMASPLWELHSRRMVHVVESAEFASLPEHILNDRAVVFSVSRSGERGLVIDSVQRAREAGAFSVAITGSAESLLAKQAQYALITAEGPEVTFPKTKSVLATTGLLMRLALAFGLPDGPRASAHLDHLEAAPATIARTIERVEPELVRLLPEITGHELVAVCGSGANLGVALEGAMKIQEASFVPVYANSTDGLINGPVGALNDRWVVIPLVGVGDEVLADQLLKIAHGFGAHSLVVAEPGVDLTEKPSYALRLAGRADSVLAPLHFLPVLQLLAYHWTVSRGMNPDAPASMAAILDAVLAPGRQEPELRKS